MFKQTIIKSFFSGFFFILGCILCIISIKAFDNWSSIPTVDTTTTLSSNLWNTSMSTLTGNIQGLENRIDNLFTPITPGTATKITYNSNGLITGGTNLVEGDLPSLSAGKITSGVFAPARLGTGTPSSSVYLRGDGIWSSISVSGTNSCSGTPHMTLLLNRMCACGGFELKQCRNGSWGIIPISCNDYC